MTIIEKAIRAEFPLLNNTDLAYLDNGATVQKPQCVLDAVNTYYTEQNANPMRGLYELSIKATEIYEEARKETASFINAASPEEIVFTRNATESLNLVSYSYAGSVLEEGDEVIVSCAEHHSNMLPWIRAAKNAGAKLLWYDCEPDGSFDTEKLTAMLSGRTKILAITQVSNVLGRENDIRVMSELIHEKGGIIVVDGSQAVPHLKTDVRSLDADFYAFSGHKMYAPMGIGALYAKKELLEKMPPFLYGGEMIESVTKEKITYAEVPHKFEAGTVNAGGAAGLLEAIRFLRRYGMEEIAQRESDLTAVAFEGMRKIPHIRILGADEAAGHHGILAFQVEGVHPHDVAAIMSDHKIAVRAGHHCAQPLHKHLGVMSSTRMSLSFYNTEDEVRYFLEVLSKVRPLMGYPE
ncbi:MAG: SufS family cysteine desulfurase [Lachnospiraceae bacterium]|nr:SufS family cysteine desulfurase [Lachnospiraceae bacterium]